MQRLLVIYLFLALSALHINAQKKSAQKLYDEAAQQINFLEAERLYQQAIDKDSSYAEAYIALSRLYEQRSDYNKQVNILRYGAKNGRQNQAFVTAQYAKAAYLNGNYKDAQEALLKIGDFTDYQLLHLQNCINFSLDAISHPWEFNPENLGKDINTKHHDYWPSLSIDEKQIVTTVFVDDIDEQVLNTAQEDLYISKKDGEIWSKARPVTPIINSIENEGAQALSADGNIMLFTACNRFDGYGSCDIFITHKKNGVWSPPLPLPSPINTEYWEGHPCLSADSKQLYFASSRKGGVGGVDIYVANIKIEDGVKVFGVENLGKSINSSKDEVSPFIHSDNQTLYFSSDGHIGLGRQDIFFSKMSDTNIFQEAVNLGYPINTHKDEIGFVVSPLGLRAYFSSEREDSQKKDIYAFDLPQDLRPKEVTYLKANISDKLEQKPLESEVEVSLISTGEIAYQASKVSNFTIPLPMGKDYAINVSKEGYLFYSANIALSEDTETPFEKDILLSHIQRGEKIVLKNILFKHDSYELDISYTAELDKAIALIIANPKLQFEISGHTDNLGSETHNQKLSEQRAKVVYDYFISEGIDAQQLSYKGYGQSQPVSNRNKENRRTELLIK